MHIKNIKIDLLGKHYDWQFGPLNIIVGKNGTGKSTILKKISHDTGDMYIDDICKAIVELDNGSIIKLDGSKSLDSVFFIDMLNFGLVSVTNLIASFYRNYKNIPNLVIFSDIINELYDKDTGFIYRQEKAYELLWQLSLGEQNMLVILITALLQREKKCIFIIDNPEIALGIIWQKKLIDNIVKINPNCQLILATHSPSIVNGNWDHVFNFDK
jgi:predicted ATPase